MRKYIVFKQEGKYKKIFIEEILYCKAEGAYTKIWLNNNEEFFVSKLLKEVEKLLANYNFFRINRSYLVNLDHCHEILTNSTRELRLLNGVKLAISRSRIKLLVERFCTYS